MKKILTIFITILSLQGIAQEWAPIGAKWHYTEFTINPDVISYSTFESIAEDTVNGIPCKKVIEIDKYWGDTIIKTHYMYSENDSVFFFKEGEFHLLYDFGAIEGDTIVLDYFWTASGDPLLMIVDSTSIIDINGETRIIQYVTCGDGIVIEFAEEMIEGIGSTYYMFPTLDGQPYGPLRCYEDSVLGLFLSPFHPNWGWNFEECNEIITGIGEIDVDASISVFPNPFNFSTTIEYELSKPSQVQFTIYNMTGETIYMVEERRMSQGKHSLMWPPERLPQGLYIIEVILDGHRFSEKLIVQ